MFLAKGWSDLEQNFSCAPRSCIGILREGAHGKNKQKLVRMEKTVGFQPDFFNKKAEARALAPALQF